MIYWFGLGGFGCSKDCGWVCVADFGFWVLVADVRCCLFGLWNAALVAVAVLVWVVVFVVGLLLIVWLVLVELVGVSVLLLD